MAGQLTGKTVVIIVAHEFEDIELLYLSGAETQRGGS